MAHLDRFSLTLDPELGRAVRAAAGRQGASVSAWLGTAAAHRLRNEELGTALDAWEGEDGRFTDVELKEAAQALGVPWQSSKR